jgi:hypothetical protein
VATYKVIQDIEAEDKLLGPLTLRQFIYAAIVCAMGFVSYKLFPISPFLVIPFLPPMVFFAMLAAPFGHDQPAEVWMLARIRFFLKPRRRIWNQDGVQELVTITVPKKIEKHLTDGLNQYEVKSRLQALASTLDSRGWAIKNVSVNMFSQPSYLVGAGTDTDRLVDVDSLPQEVPAYEVYDTDDIMDESSNPTAQHLDSMITQSEQAHRQAVVASISSSGAQTSQPQADYWFMNEASKAPVNQPGYTNFSNNPVVFPGMDSQQPSPTRAEIPKDVEEKVLSRIRKDKSTTKSSYSHLKTLQPLSTQQATTSQNDTVIPVLPDDDTNNRRADDGQGQAAGSTPANPVILRLANNDDLNVATLAREAKKANPEILDDDVVISLR